MCGIAGLVHREAGSQRALVESITTRLAHRGPDGAGYWPAEAEARSHAWLGHRRLSIIDVAAGAQPMCNEDATLWIIYNGEIFNHAALRPGLEAAGHRYRTHCDTETVLHAWEQSGADCLREFRGMFAFALWDTKRQELFCVRDRLGIKPLYYYCDGGHFVFGKELVGHQFLIAFYLPGLAPVYRGR